MRAVGPLGPFLLVVDRFLPQDDQAHSYQVLWHLSADAAETDGVIVRTRDPGLPNLSIVPAASSGLYVDIISGQESPEWQGWKAIKNHQQGDFAPTPTAVYQLDATGPVRLVSVLYPTPPGEVCLIQAIQASSDVDETSIRLQLTDGSAISLSENSPCPAP